MNSEDFYLVFMLVFLLLCSALFSGAEVAFFSLEKRKLKELKKTRRLVVSYIESLLDYPKRLLVTVLLANTMANTAASIIGVKLALDFAVAFNYPKALVIAVQIIVLTFLILIFGEYTPKVWANRYPLKFAQIASIPLYWVGVLLFPAAKIITELIRLSSVSKLRVNRGKTAFSSSEIVDLTFMGVQKGTIEEEEGELIEGLVEFKSVTVREVMTPRVDIAAISLETEFGDLIQAINSSGHSRIPLYDGSIDNIVGVIYAKDLLPFIQDEHSRRNFSLKKLARKTLYVPEGKHINELMREFQAKNIHIGIVVDEYGGTAGLVSLDDILEEIVGEIRDEYDKDEKDITQTGENSFMILGKTPIDEVTELLGVDLAGENPDYDTLGGFILNLIGNIPQEGFKVNFSGYRFTVSKVENKRIKKVFVERTIPEEDEPSKEN